MTLRLFLENLLSMRLLSILGVTVFLGLLASCVNTADVTSHEGSICKVHLRLMTVQIVKCAPGWSGYYADNYPDALYREFPHHGGLHFNDDHLIFLSARHLRTHVCPACTQAHVQWLVAHPGHPVEKASSIR